MTPEQAAYDAWVFGAYERHCEEFDRNYECANFPKSTVKIRRDDSWGEICPDEPVHYVVFNNFYSDWCVDNLKQAIRRKRRFLHWIKERRKRFIFGSERKHRKYSDTELENYYPMSCPMCGWKGLSNEGIGGEQIADTGDHSAVVCPDCYAQGFGNFFELEDDEYGYNEQIGRADL